MHSLLRWIFGVPLGEADIEATFRRMMGKRGPEEALEFVLVGIKHNTEKAGALLGAQGIFVVVATFALDHGMPKDLVIAAIILLLAGSLLLMTTLRSTVGPMSGERTKEIGRDAFEFLQSRIIRFNIALFLTFVAVILLASGMLTLL